MSCPAEPFDERAYLALYPDVALAVRNGTFSSGYEHWMAHGKNENRLCSAPDDGDFDELDYLLRYPDVRTAIEQGVFHSGYEHWTRTGRTENRIGRREHYSYQRYLDLNPDVASAIQAGLFPSAHEHWERHGQFEMRAGAPPDWRQRWEIDRQLPAGVNQFGFHGWPSGLGQAAIGYAAAVSDAGLPLALIDAPDWADPAATQSVDVSEAAPYRVNLIHQNADVMARWGTRYAQTAFPGRYNVGLWVWELHAAYPEVHAVSTFLNEIWVPSEYVVNAFRNLSAAPVSCVPYVVEPVCHTLLDRSHFGIPEDVFVFLYAFDVSSNWERKNPVALLSAFRMAFGGDPSVMLIFKYTKPEHNPMRVWLFERIAAVYPNVRTISGILSENDHQNLIRLSDCFVSPHRCEGFGLNIAAAMHHGVPVIATGYSGSLDFADNSTAELIDYSLVPVGPGNHPYQAEYAWAEPDVYHLKELLQSVRADPEPTRAKAAEGRRRLLERNSRHAVGALIKERLSAAGVLD